MGMRVRVRGKSQSYQGNEEETDQSGHARHNITECGVKVACNSVAIRRC
jgi:hypothetical protein